MRVLVIVAHPDDETFGCGGTISRHHDQNDLIRVVYATPGTHSRGGSDAADIRAREAANALHQLAPSATSHQLSFPDQDLFAHMPALISRLAEEVTAFGPDRVYFNGADGNDDHVAIDRAVQVSCRPQPGRAYPVQLLRFVIAEWRVWGAKFRPTAYVRLDASHVAKRGAAIAGYNSERRDCSHPRSADRQKDLMGMDGSSCGEPWAEAFEVVRWIE